MVIGDQAALKPVEKLSSTFDLESGFQSPTLFGITKPLLQLYVRRAPTDATRLKLQVIIALSTLEQPATCQT